MTARSRPVPLDMDPLEGVEFAPAPAASGTFGPERQARKAPAVRARLAEKPAWSAYRGPRTPCHEGVRQTHQGGPRPHIDHARYRRKFRGEEHLLCGPCGTVWHAADGYVTPLPSTIRKIV